ncbi:MAG: acetyltransferase [Bacteroidota bacterium]
MKSLRKIIILGAGENGRVAENILLQNGKKDISFVDDNLKLNGVIGPLNMINSLDIKSYNFFVSFGSDIMRKKWFKRLTVGRKNLINAIHPSARLEKSVRLGKNVMIGAHAYINIGSRIGDNVIVNSGCIIEHDNNIGDNVQIGPGVITGGGVIIKDNSFIGMGAVIIDHITVASNNIIGASSVIVADTKPRGVYLGIPAKRKKSI